MALAFKRLAVSAFIVSHMTAVVLWNLPTTCPLRQRTESWISYYIVPTGNWQYWGMFAPDPVKETVSFEALVIDGRGLMHTFPFPKNAGKPPWESVFTFRHSKYISNIRLDDYATSRQAAAHYVVRAMGLKDDDFPLNVQLIYQVILPPKPGEPSNEGSVPPVPVVLESFQFPTLEEAQP